MNPTKWEYILQNHEHYPHSICFSSIDSYWLIRDSYSHIVYSISYPYFLLKTNEVKTQNKLFLCFLIYLKVSRKNAYVAVTLNFIHHKRYRSNWAISRWWRKSDRLEFYRIVSIFISRLFSSIENALNYKMSFILMLSFSNDRSTFVRVQEKRYWQWGRKKTIHLCMINISMSYQLDSQVIINRLFVSILIHQRVHGWFNHCLHCKFCYSKWTDFCCSNLLHLRRKKDFFSMRPPSVSN